MIELSGQRVLHIVEPWSGPASSWLSGGSGCDTLAAACVLHADPRVDRFLVLGPARAEQRLAALGAPTTDTICPPARRVSLAWRAVRRFIARAGPFDAIVCWGDRLGRLALRLDLSRTAIYRARLTARSGETGPADGLAPRAHGLPQTDRAGWRHAHGVSDDEPVIALLDDAGAGASVRRFLFVLGAVEIADRPVVGLFPSDAAGRGRSRRFQGAVGLRTRLIMADRPMQTLLSVADAGVILGASAGNDASAAHAIDRLNLRLAAAAGLPTVTAEQPGVTDDLPEEAARLLARSAHSTDLGRELYELVVDSRRRAAAGAALRNASASAGPAWLDCVRIGSLAGPGRASG